MTHSIHYFYRSQWNEARNGYQTILPARAMVYLAGLLNSMVLDFVVRRKVDAHVTKSVMATVPIADIPLDSGPGAEIVGLSARLTCRSPDFAELGRGARLRVRTADTRTGADAARRTRRAGRPLVRPIGDPAWTWCSPTSGRARTPTGVPVRPDDEYKTLVRREFARLGGEGGTAPAA